MATRTNPEVDAKEPPSEFFVAVIMGFKERVEAGAVHRLYFCTGVFDGEVVELKEAHAFGADAVVAAGVEVFALQPKIVGVGFTKFDLPSDGVEIPAGE